MRLRLSVQRHRLPPTNVLWSVPDNASPQVYTIAKLLEDVNATLPLEAEQWGLEDYVVEVDGFECLHFSPVCQSLKDDDHVSIRPLLTAEVRSRTLCGRHQISDNGQHLLDGVPFGRPLLRAHPRPPIRIPPRKRQRLMGDAVVEGDHPDTADLTTASGEAPELGIGVGLSSGDVDCGHEGTPMPKRKKASKFVRFEPLSVEMSDDGDDEDFVLDGGSEASSASTSSNSDTPTSDSDSDTTSSSESESDSDSDSDGESGESSGPEVLSSKPTVAPKKGLKKTRYRNKRRAASRKLAELKSKGVLPANASFETMRTFRNTTNKRTGQGDLDTAAAGSSLARTGTEKRKRDDKESSVEQPAIGQAGDIEAEFQQRKRALMAQVSQEQPVVEPAAKPSGSQKRLRPDVAAFGRILSHQVRPLEKKPTKAKAAPAQEPQTPPDPDFWKSRINLTAFECWEEGYDLSAPSFPFKQHWDPNCKLMREKGKRKQKKGASKKSPDGNAPAADNGSDTPELDYGDPPASQEKSDYSTASAIESQLWHDVATASRSDLEPLPEDVGALPALFRGRHQERSNHRFQVARNKHGEHESRN